MRSFSYIPDASFSEEFLLHSYTPVARFSEEFLLHSSGYVWSGVCLTLLVLVLAKSFSYTPGARLSEEFFLHTAC